MSSKELQERKSAREGFFLLLLIISCAFLAGYLIGSRAYEEPASSGACDPCEPTKLDQGRAVRSLLSPEQRRGGKVR